MMRFLPFLIVLFFAFPVLAATDDFTVNLFVNGDVTPPTTPGTLVAVPVSSSRIDLSWGASTDNYLMGGYQVFRDAVQIATTTLNSYSDTGLTASTTYTYNVRAFDHTFNFSTSSNSVSTSTLEYVAPTTPTTTPDSPSTQATKTSVKIVDLKIEPGITSAVLQWTTNQPARYTLRWGRTFDYELGFVTTHTFQFDHETAIGDLEPNTVYEYELIGYDRGNNPVVLAQAQFKTLNQPDHTPPPNVSTFTGRAEASDAVLSWQNPSTDFSYVRIVRNPFFYPTDPNNGYVVYEGADQSFRDKEVFSDWDVVYYTAFVYDTSGNRSSGAVTFVEVASEFVSTDESGAPRSTRPDVVVTEDDLTPIPAEEPFSISFDDVSIVQDGEVLRAVDSAFVVDTTRPFTIYAPYELFPQHLKAIQVSLFHPVDLTSSQAFLLRINADKTAYEATINNLEFSGTIPMRLVVYDFTTKAIATAEGSIVSKQPESPVVVVRDILLPWYARLQWLWIFLVLAAIGWWLLGWKRRRAEDKPPVRFS